MRLFYFSVNFVSYPLYLIKKTLLFLDHILFKILKSILLFFLKLEFMEHLHCFKSEEFIAPMHLCMDKFIVQMEQMPDIPTTQRIPSMCCSYHMLRDCLKTKAMISCEKKESIEYIDNIATEVVSIQ